MNSGQFDMRSLLDQAGFRLRGTTRADCIHCTGGSRSTVSFTGEVAFCHRCHWRANTIMLARQLGLLRSSTEAARAFGEEARRRAVTDAKIGRFEEWRQARIREVSDKFRSLSSTAVRAEEILRGFPDCEPAWDALARFYHARAQLSAAFDWLMFAKVSEWLEEDSSPSEVFETWRNHAA